MARKQLSGSIVPNLATGSLPTPTAGLKGLVLFDSTSGTLKYCNGTAWVEPSGSAARTFFLR